MIQAQPISRQAPRWQHALREAFTRPAELLAWLELDPALPQLDLPGLRDFPLRVPRGFAARMRKGDPLDPLFLQVWPAAREAETVPGFVADAVGDMDSAQGDGVLHKYQGRALLITTGACAVHCRYCFRRHFPYSESLAARGHWQPALDRLAADPSITEAILSGGDPFSLSDERLAELFEGLAGIPHLRRVRVHTRQPIVLPERIDAGLLKILRSVSLDKVMVVHANHAQELTGDVPQALADLRTNGWMLLNQSVLLRGINDTTNALQGLHERLFSLGILPYYLHLLDRVKGAAHFEVPEHRARELMRDLSSISPGYLVPRLAREVPGDPAKAWLSW
ncbi:L-lysine 2,3-aminomutase [Panacagrimonas perspica]|uniref:L-lysine 2,3-aminomutase n=1 Tax=Panacagrimonas perspica TaxID=381431 RepID=A0A4S3KBP7_9GAMM|nr:EF-P beta-lysylation protein EpmB [Panacagrimonas perspica]TDU32359.1 L-lysine 2,3-aminomutase [Panacagrimonas perspica]THD05294.1 EF-P beta-lysylation protein EpmB [Panacagrimonas perspica]